MAAAVRIYAVETAGKTRLVRASNKVQALNHVARDTIKAEVAGQDVLVALISLGVKVEDAGELPGEPAGE